jgi:hypothetical protein
MALDEGCAPDQRRIRIALVMQHSNFQSRRLGDRSDHSFVKHRRGAGPIPLRGPRPGEIVAGNRRVRACGDAGVELRRRGVEVARAHPRYAGQIAQRGRRFGDRGVPLDELVHNVIASIGERRGRRVRQQAEVLRVGFQEAQETVQLLCCRRHHTASAPPAAAQPARASLARARSDSKTARLGRKR